MVIKTPTGTNSICDMGTPVFLQAQGICGAGGPYNYEWQMLDGPDGAGHISDTRAADTSFTATAPGAYRMQVRVTDASGESLLVPFHLFVPEVMDLNGDNNVNRADWLMRLDYWSDEVLDAPGMDANLDGTIDLLDLLIAAPCETSDQ